MKTSKRIVAIVTLALALLLISSPFIGFSSPTASTVDASGVPASVTQAGGFGDYGDIMQYEWSTFAHDECHTRFNPGPAPDKPEVLWQARGSVQAAFDEKVFVTRYGRDPETGRVGLRLRALDPFNATEIWGTSLLFGGFSATMSKIDDNYFYVDNNFGVEVYRIDDGAYVSNFNITGGGVIYEQPGSASYFPGRFSSELKMKYRVVHNTSSLENSIVAVDLSDPLNPHSAWNYTCDEPSQLLACGDGKLFVGAFQGAVYALNGTTGELVWRSPKIGMVNTYSATYYDGKLYQGCATTRLTCYDGEDGTILWDYDAGGRAFFVYGGAAAYGRIYFHNNNPWGGFVGCWDAETGDMLWKQPRDYYIGYIQPAMADGKLYIASEGGVVGGVELSPPTFACFDAFSGEKLWEIPMTIGTPIIAYGNLYGSVGIAAYCFGPPKTPEPWSYFRGNMDNPGVAVEQYGPTTLNLKWKFTTGGPVTSSPAVVDDKVYIGSNDKNIYCLDAYTGSKIWNFTTGFRVASSPAVVDGRVYVGPDDGYIYCLDAGTGTQIWKEDAGGFYPSFMVEVASWQVRSSPIIVGNRLYVGALDNKVYCLDTDDGSKLWTYPTGMPIVGSPAYADGVVYIASTDRKVYALDATTGTHIWNWTTPQVVTGWTWLFMVGTPTVADGKVFIGGGAHSLAAIGVIFVALNATTGEPVWITEVDPGWGNNQPWAATYVNGVLYIPRGMNVAAFNAKDGSLRWEQWLGFQVFSSVAYADDPMDAKIYVGCDSYSVTCLDPASGEPLSSYTTGAQVVSSPAIYGGKLYVGSCDYNVYCLDDAPTIPTSIWAESSKGATCWPNETVVISGALDPGIPNQQILVTFTKPDQTLVNVTTTTNERGYFSVSYTPDVAGNYTWMAWYEGADVVSRSYTYAYGDLNSLEVAEEEQPPSPPTDEEEEEGIPMEYIYAIVAVIAIIIIAIAAYAYMKRRKK